ncbi:hypothetical protein [Marinoscillum sp. MHG1-6]|uniref:hypothetical protein n=1 Tax=Marinoscillum sp. MHG1-6 TaxID=2959627 RepID=UPI00215715FC|nr:hypothetical protein [Marinoscillum sp. MHG1-6]
MTEAISPSLLSTWNMYGQLLAYALMGVGVLILLGHYLKLLFTKDFKTRYDYINMHEINLLWYGFVLVLSGIALYINTVVTETTWLWFFVRIFVSGMMAMIIGVVVQNVLKFYYPFFIEKRLKKLRYSPRLSPDGRKMKLLSEEEEDVYLDEGMQAEENAFSVDYDVWIDEISGFTKIEKYNGRLHALQCDECNYQTLKVEREEIIQEASEVEEGELMKYYVCGYCGHKQRKSFKIAKLRAGEGASA